MLSPFCFTFNHKLCEYSNRVPDAIPIDGAFYPIF